MSIVKLIKTYRVLIREWLNFSLSKPERPDFSQQPIELIIAGHCSIGEDKPKDFSYVAIFSDVPPSTAKKYRWVGSYSEYLVLACLEFIRRYPNHELSRRWRKLISFSDDDILAVSQGRIRLVVE